ncbi:hypothetical protein [Methylocystis sp. B8]|uniref:hypothetical protein n=1 Tax=Methylocystis sp. B8 TaxID=544938 RepID=UPI0010FE81C1|nr:hypothetical protein [Methylocystis sp. B8]TLG79045.1 hypothetical protein FEV16_03185 [Methylocystis sp. B8]
MRELESLERPFRKTRAIDWIKDFVSDLIGEWRAMQDSASSKAPLWFFVVGAIILLGGGVLVAHLALKGAPQQRNDVTALRSNETPPTQPAAPAPETQAAQIAEAAPVATAPASAEQEAIAPPAQQAAGVTALRERLIEAQSATEPLPEPLPPPTAKAEAPASPPSLDAAPASPLDEAQSKTAFDGAPPVDAAGPAEPESVAPVREVERQQQPADEGRPVQCFVKVDGRVLFEKSCLLRQAGRSSFTLIAGKNSVVLKLDHGRSWTATLGGESLGPVYRTGQCWGRRREVYICAKGA